VVERFSRKAHALRAAIRAAEALWSEDGVPTDVSVHVAPGRWRDERKFG
jgi:hypothetical protein